MNVLVNEIKSFHRLKICVPNLYQTQNFLHLIRYYMEFQSNPCPLPSRQLLLLYAESRLYPMLRSQERAPWPSCLQNLTEINWASVKRYSAGRQCIEDSYCGWLHTGAKSYHGNAILPWDAVPIRLWGITSSTRNSHKYECFWQHSCWQSYLNVTWERANGTMWTTICYKV